MKKEKKMVLFLFCLKDQISKKFQKLEKKLTWWSKLPVERPNLETKHRKWNVFHEAYSVSDNHSRSRIPSDKPHADSRFSRSIEIPLLFLSSPSASASRKPESDSQFSQSSSDFSGYFFERISTGFGNCILRRVESHHQGKQPKIGGSVVVFWFEEGEDWRRKMKNTRKKKEKTLGFFFLG